ncbi:MAG TPA: TonB-dependent receptor, partial [Sphingobacteriaceae bacterium]
NSVFRINERETFDVEGHYIFDELESGKSATVKANLASGTRSAHARNHLRADIYSTELKAYLQKGRSYFESGLRYQFDRIDDSLNEYSVIDTAGDTSAGRGLSDVVSSENQVSTSRISFYMQDVVAINSRLTLSAGVRGNFNTGNREFLLTPRVSLAFQPQNPDVTYRFAAGSYSQPSFYREMRMFNGQLVHNTRAQRSVHFLAGLDRSFVKLNTRIKFTSEVYYKALSDLVPYKIENLRVRYLADQRAKGYAAGVDLSFSGELVKDMESSFRLSLMKTMEDIEGDFFNRTTASGSTERVEPGLLKRPADQRINASVFFQDKLFNSPSNKVHLTLLYGSSLPVGPPQTERYRDVFKIPAYKRADIGFSKDFLDASLQRRSAKLNKYFSSFILYAGVFNLLDNNNTVSYLWLKDAYDNQYAIPNYLSGRRLNVKLIAGFK